MFTCKHSCVYPVTEHSTKNKSQIVDNHNRAQNKNKVQKQHKHCIRSNCCRIRNTQNVTEIIIIVVVVDVVVIIVVVWSNNMVNVETFVDRGWWCKDAPCWRQVHKLIVSAKYRRHHNVLHRCSSLNCPLNKLDSQWAQWRSGERSPLLVRAPRVGTKRQPAQTPRKNFNCCLRDFHWRGWGDDGQCRTFRRAKTSLNAQRSALGVHARAHAHRARCSLLGSTATHSYCGTVEQLSRTPPRPPARN